MDGEDNNAAAADAAEADDDEDADKADQTSYVYMSDESAGALAWLAKTMMVMMMRKETDTMPLLMFR